MMRSLFAGVSGLRNHQVRMDVIGNNIANVNTVAFKSGRVTFKEGFAQLLQGASRPPGDLGGTNPIQVGLGMQIGSVDMMFSQGNLETTGLATDVAIQGDSFFVVKKGTQNYYTRSGNFQLDSLGQLVSPTNGFVVQGKMAENGVFLPGVQNITLPVGQKTAAKATDTTTLAGNLDAAAPIFTGTFDATGRADPLNVDSWTESSITVFDSLGNQHDLKIQFWKTAADTWSWQLDGTNLPAGFTPAQLDAADADVRHRRPAHDGGPHLAAGDHLHPLGRCRRERHAGTRHRHRERHHVVCRNQQRRPEGPERLRGGPAAELHDRPHGHNNPGGLLRVGDNMYSVSGNSGGPVLGYSLQGVQSTISSGALEMSNVDLAQEFTNMIVTQRGFQANSRVITSSDEMLQELVNLKR
ncbi:MAG: flagellar hook protein FlgE [Gemmatimonadetes bacterium]|nr:flagellar hook protein FlgE [Gemmatimonadota bacterium]